MAWPDTADFPAGWSFPVGFDGTDYSGTWVLDAPNAMPTKAAALKAVWAPNGWAVIQTTSFLFTDEDTISLGVKVGEGFGPVYVIVILFDEGGNLVEGTAYRNLAPGTSYDGLSILLSAPRLTIGGRYTAMIFARQGAAGSNLYLGDLNVGGVSSSGYEADKPRPVTFFPVNASPSIGGGGSNWPGPLETPGFLPSGWQYDDEGAIESDGVVLGPPFYGAGSNGTGTSVSIDIAAAWPGDPVSTFGFGVVTPLLPANSVVSFKYHNWMQIDVFEGQEGVFDYSGEWVTEYTEPSRVSGWQQVHHGVGSVPEQIVFYTKDNYSFIILAVCNVLGSRYMPLIDDFQIQPMLTSDGDAESEVGYIVGGIFRWEANQIVTTEAVATEELQRLTYPWMGADAGGYYPWPLLVPPTPGVAWDFLDDVAFASEDYGVGVSGSITIVSYATLSDAADAGVELDNPDEPVLESSAIIFDQHEPLTIGPSLLNLATGDELPTLSVVASLTLDQDVLAADLQTLQFVRELEDVASAEEVATGTMAQVQVSAGVAAQDVIPGATADLLLVEDAQALELVEPGAAAMVEDVAAGFEDATPAAVLPVLVSDAVGTTEVFDQADAPPAVLEGAAAASDELLAQVTRAASLESAAVAEDLALYAQPGAVALVMNTETAAVSWYENWQFTDMAQVGNTVLAIGPEGLAVLGGNTDAGDRISASLAWGYRDFGSEQKKRVDSFWFGYSATGLLQVGVQTFGQGYGRFVYRMENRQATKGRNNRVTPGKGLNARYWKVDISNVSGCAFDVDSMGVELLTSTRRI